MTLDQLFDVISPHGEAEVIIERGALWPWRAAVFVVTDAGDMPRYQATGYTARVALMNLETELLRLTRLDISDWQEVQS